jgi:hypothetical protein
MTNTVTAAEFYERVYSARRDSAAAQELYQLVNDLMDEVGYDGLLGKIDSYKDDCSEEAQAHYKACISA